jgi:sialate O-acetylesterase
MKIFSSYRFTLTLIFLTGLGLKSYAQTTPAFKVANLLQSNMVIQQDKPLRVWGTAKPGDIIKINADWTGKVTTTQADAQGNWLGEIKVPKAIPGNFTPHTMVIIDGNDNIKLDNLLIGDVWFCVGQSNMDFVMEPALMLTYRGVLNYQSEIAAANYPAIRIYHLWTDFKINPVTTTTGIWKVCSPETIKNFSAVAYFFGRELFVKLNIPIGLVESAAAGASTQAFTSREVLESDTLLAHTYLDGSRDLLSSQKAVDTTGFFSKVTEPTLLYNDIIYPVLNLSIKGVAYYQGESNTTDSKETYIPLFTKMVANWRRDFKQGDLPFYYTQIAPYRDTNDTTTWATANFRDIQEHLLKIKNTGMAVTMDVGEERKVHPRDKKSVGERLAFNALNKTYHLKYIAYQGPHFSGFKVKGNTVTISFDTKSIGTGLTTNNGKAPRHFFVAGADHQFYYADAKIVGDKVVLTSDKVANPVAVRYAFTDAPVTNLEDEQGLPALPFRTDNW